MDGMLPLQKCYTILIGANMFRFRHFSAGVGGVPGGGEVSSTGGYERARK